MLGSAAKLSRAWESIILPLSSRYNDLRLKRRQTGKRLPRIALVKQDCNEDLYCCASGAPVLETIQSTLLRSGPAALFMLFDTTFFVVKTEPDAECNIWKEKWDPLKWCPIEWFENFRKRVPGRDYGQSRFAKSVDEINWAEFDLVISIDVSVPARVTARYPGVVWAYFVRELKAPSWQRSFDQPIAGQDIYLSQRFSPRLPRSALHVVDFPYHFHYYGMFHQMSGLPVPTEGEGESRSGVFVEYHTARMATPEQLRRLEEFGPVYAKTPSDDRIDEVSGDRIPTCSMEPDALSALMRSKYHVKWGGRNVLGIAKVEAIAAGCLALSDPALDGTSFMLSPALSVSGFDELIEKLRSLEASQPLYRKEVIRQCRLLDHLCFRRPANRLLDVWESTRNSKIRASSESHR